MTLLRKIALIGDQVSHHLQAAGNFLHQIERQVHEFIQNPIKPDPHDQCAFPRLDMNIAGARLDRIEYQVVNEDGDLNFFLIGDRL